MLILPQKCHHIFTFHTQKTKDIIINIIKNKVVVLVLRSINQCERENNLGRIELGNCYAD